MVLQLGLVEMIQDCSNKLDFMRNPYYVFWADAINSYRHYHPLDESWKAKLLTMNSFVQGMGVWTIYIILKWLNIISFDLPYIDVFPGKMINSALSFAVPTVLPMGVINYFLIFRNERYRKLLSKYPGINKLALYSTISTVIVGLTVTLIYSFVTF